VAKIEKEAEELMGSSTANALISSRSISTSKGTPIYHTMMNTAIGDEAIVDMFLSSGERTRQEVRHDNPSGIPL
jgi:hypothetical protein